ncbi:MAG: hypothetical protein WC236_14640 [Gallionellaceae bacterium]|jgi:hypothetical protein
MVNESAVSVKKTIDWEAVELDYRAGIKSLKVIGAEFGVSDAGILKRAKRDGWTRDLAAKIRAKADAKVSADAVSAEVSALTKVAEKEIVEANAELQARVRREQRADISRSRKLVMTLLGELEETTDSLELYKQLGELLYAPDEKGVDKLNELYQKVISLGGRTGTMKSLADSLKTLVALEREAFGIDERKTNDTQTVFNMQF